MSRRVLVFDLDDTLHSERAFAISGFRAAERWAARELGLGDLVAPMTQLLDDGHLRELFALILAERMPRHTPAHLEGFIASYRDHEPEIVLYEDADRALTHFGALGPLGLITDGSPALQERKVRVLGLESRLHHRIYTHALGGRAFAKPHPRAFEHMEAALGAPGDTFVYVGDNPAKDFVAPNARGWVTVQIVRPQQIHRRAQVAEGGVPQHRVESLEELASLLG
jgi:putative hydrolase of the HAD superfamily